MHINGKFVCCLFAATAKPNDSVQLKMCYMSLSDYQHFEYDALSYTLDNPLLETKSPLAPGLRQSFITMPKD